MAIFKVTIFQKSLNGGLNLAAFKRLGSVKSDFLLFPEYFFADSDVQDYRNASERSRHALDWLLKLNSAYRGVIIGGSVVHSEEDANYNATPVISDGQVVDWYRKRQLNPGEAKLLAPGTEPGVFILAGHRFAVLIEKDALCEDYFKELAEMGIRVIFVLMNSAESNGKSAELFHDEAFCKPARDHGLYIVKCCAVGSMFGNPVEGRSMVVTPSGISWRVSEAETDQEILKTVMINVEN